MRYQMALLESEKRLIVDEMDLYSRMENVGWVTLHCNAVFNQILGLWGRLEAAWSQPQENRGNKTVAEGEGGFGARHWYH